MAKTSNDHAGRRLSGASWQNFNPLWFVVVRAMDCLAGVKASESGWFLGEWHRAFFEHDAGVT